MGGPGCRHQGSCCSEAEEADKGNDVVVNKDDSKQAKPKPKQSAHHLKKKDSSKKIKPLNDNLDEYFGLNQSQNSQETADVTPINTPKEVRGSQIKK